MPVAAHQGNGDQLFAGRGKPGNSKMRTNQNLLGLRSARTKATPLRENAEKKRAGKIQFQTPSVTTEISKEADPAAGGGNLEIVKNKFKTTANGQNVSKYIKMH